MALGRRARRRGAAEWRTKTWAGDVTVRKISPSEMGGGLRDHALPQRGRHPGAHPRRPRRREVRLRQLLWRRHLRAGSMPVCCVAAEPAKRARLLAVTAHSLVRGSNLSVRDLASLRSSRSTSPSGRVTGRTHSRACGGHWDWEAWARPTCRSGQVKLKAAAWHAPSSSVVANGACSLLRTGTVFGFVYYRKIVGI